MKTVTLPPMVIADLCQQLALFLKAGISLYDGLFLLAEEEQDPQIRSMLTACAQQVEGGSYLSTAFQAAGVFPTHVIGLLQVGEEVGRTEETLQSLSHYYEEQDRMNRQLRNALTYPTILIFMMLIVIIVLLSKVLPVFDDVYASLGGSLTGIGGSLLALGDFINTSMPYLFALLALIIAGILLFSASPLLRHKAVRLWQHYFGDRGVSRKRNDAKFAQAMAMALNSGVPVEQGILLASSLLEDCPAAVSRCQDCRARLDAGEDLPDALKASGMLPPSACRMLTRGLRAGTADSVMDDIARRLSDEAHDTLEKRVAMIEPALVLITSLLVGAILLSVMLPLMNIMKAIG